jgi:hypothetical protein
MVEPTESGRWLRARGGRRVNYARRQQYRVAHGVRRLHPRSLGSTHRSRRRSWCTNGATPHRPSVACATANAPATTSNAEPRKAKPCAKSFCRLVTWRGDQPTWLDSRSSLVVGGHSLCGRPFGSATQPDFRGWRQTAEVDVRQLLFDSIFGRANLRPRRRALEACAAQLAGYGIGAGLALAYAGPQDPRRGSRRAAVSG